MSRFPKRVSFGSLNGKQVIGAVAVLVVMGFVAAECEAQRRGRGGRGGRRQIQRAIEQQKKLAEERAKIIQQRQEAARQAELEKRQKQQEASAARREAREARLEQIREVREQQRQPLLPTVGDVAEAEEEIDEEEEDCCCCCWGAAEDGGLLEVCFGSEDSPLKRSRNFWISGSAARSLGPGACLFEAGASGLLLSVAGACFAGEDAQSQPIVGGKCKAAIRWGLDIGSKRLDCRPRGSEEGKGDIQMD
jgi:hypothetical protein